MNHLWKLAHYFYTEDPRLKSFYYRHRDWLKKKCALYPAFEPFTFSQKLIEELARFGPCVAGEVSPSVCEKLELIKAPNDPKFYRMILAQIEIWRGFERQALQSFLESDEGKFWYQDRKKMKRKIFFEFDRSYKKSKTQALQYEDKVRDLLRRHPLLRLDDLKRIGVRNAQAILERFPYLSAYRENYLKSLQDFSLVSSLKKRNSVESDQTATA